MLQICARVKTTLSGDLRQAKPDGRLLAKFFSPLSPAERGKKLLWFFMDRERIENVMKEVGRDLAAINEPPFYVYAYERGFDIPYRFFFHSWRRRSMKRLVRGLKNRGFRIRIWRPENG